jgi:elongator complex protein 4
LVDDYTMSSFKRRTHSKSSSIPTNSSNTPDSGCTQQPTVSTAEPSLLSGLSTVDDILGFNGLPRGCTFLVRTPDPHSAWGTMISRYSLAQGLVSGDAVVVIAHEDDAKDLVSGCMWTSDVIDDSSADADDADPDMEPDGSVKIAWRYAKMKQFSTTIPKRAAGLGSVDQGDVNRHIYYAVHSTPMLYW